MVIDEKDREVKQLMAQNKQLKTTFKDCANALANHERKMVQYREQLKEAKSKTKSKPVHFNTDDELALDQHEMAKLDGIPLFRKCDRQFVSAALETMYKNNKEDLRTRVLRTNITMCAQTKKMSPRKHDKIRCLMRRRVLKIDDPAEQLKRQQETYINALISKSLTMVRENHCKKICNK